MTKNTGIVGISLGSKTCLISTVESFDKRPVIIGNQDGDRATPSCISFQAEDQVLVGTQAKLQAHRGNPKNTIQDFIHLLHANFCSDKRKAEGAIKTFREDHPNDVIIKEETGELCFNVCGGNKVVSLHECLVLLFKHLKENAEAYLGHAVDSVVLTVPMGFGKEQIKMLERGATESGFKVLQVISESASALLAYNSYNYLPAAADEKEEKSVFLVDFGGHSLDLAVMRVGADGLLYTDASESHPELGGSSIDQLLLTHFSQEFKRKTGFSLNKGENKKSLLKLISACEKAKIMLTSAATSPLFVESLHEGVDFQSSLARTRFESIIQGVMNNCVSLVKSFVANQSGKKINHVIFLGGSSKIPMFQRVVKGALEESNSTASFHTEIDAEEVSCFGAAIQVRLLDGLGLDLMKDEYLPAHLNEKSSK